MAFQNTQDIKNAVDVGRKVYWVTENYEVIKDRIGQYLIVWGRGSRGENAIGLTWLDGETLNGELHEFFIKD